MFNIEILTDLHQLARDQGSRVTFLDVETEVVKSLIENHCLLVKGAPQSGDLQYICGQLSQLNMIKLNIKRDCMLHHHHLNATIAGSAIKSAGFLKAESDRITLEITDIYKGFKKLKKQLLIFRKSTLQKSIGPQLRS
jgi:hypothetical protein